MPYIISDVLGYDNKDQGIHLLNYSLTSSHGLYPTATLKIELKNQIYQETAWGNGQYDAFMKALRKIYKNLDKEFPALVNYSVTIPPGGRTDAFVQTIISWKHKDKLFRTTGLAGDQTEAAIIATMKMLNIIQEK